MSKARKRLAGKVPGPRKSKFMGGAYHSQVGVGRV